MSSSNTPQNGKQPIGLFGWVFRITILIAGVPLVLSIILNAIKDATKDPRLDYPISMECDRAMKASAADLSENGEKLLVETGNICGSRKEWEAALYRYPAAIGGSSTEYLDGTEYDLLCSRHEDLFICKNP